MTNEELQDVFEKKARAGDGQYAIAYSLLMLASAQGATGRAIQRLGNGDANAQYGAIEGLAMSVARVAEAISQQET
jgi:hypothetical protein